MASGAGAHRARDIRCSVLHRQSPAERPAMFARMVLEPILDFIDSSVLQTMAPERLGTVTVVQMEHIIPLFSIGRTFYHACEGIRLPILIIMAAVCTGRLDHLRHDIRNGAEPGYAFPQGFFSFD